MCSPAGKWMSRPIFLFQWGWKWGNSRHVYYLLGPWCLWAFQHLREFSKNEHSPSPSLYLAWKTLSVFWDLCVVLEDRVDLNLLRIQALEERKGKVDIKYLGLSTPDSSSRACRFWATPNLQNSEVSVLHKNKIIFCLKLLQCSFITFLFQADRQRLWHYLSNVRQKRTTPMSLLPSKLSQNA